MSDDNNKQCGSYAAEARRDERPLATFFDTIERDGTDTSKFSLKDATRLVREDRDSGH